jgi:hypothetical protein
MAMLQHEHSRCNNMPGALEAVDQASNSAR